MGLIGVGTGLASSTIIGAAAGSYYGYTQDARNPKALGKHDAALKWGLCGAVTGFLVPAFLLGFVDGITGGSLWGGKLISG
jgi:hypothetical protein